MTCIVGCIDKDGKNVIMGADSAGVSDLDITVRKDVKVFKNSNFVIGCTSSFRMIQLLRFSFTPPAVGKKDVYEYMCTSFIDEVRKCFEKGGYMQKEKNGDDLGGDFLVGYKNRLFRIDEDFQVGESYDGFDAVGCGRPYALGSLFTTTNSNMQTKDRILKALDVASKCSAGVCEPFIIEQT